MLFREYLLRRFLAFAMLPTTFELLHCVDVNGARIVFRAATVE